MLPHRDILRVSKSRVGRQVKRCAPRVRRPGGEPLSSYVTRLRSHLPSQEASAWPWAPPAPAPPHPARRARTLAGRGPPRRASALRPQRPARGLPGPLLPGPVICSGGGAAPRGGPRTRRRLKSSGGGSCGASSTASCSRAPRAARPARCAARRRHGQAPD